jgi:hypothetical protein
MPDQAGCEDARPGIGPTTLVPTSSMHVDVYNDLKAARTSSWQGVRSSGGLTAVLQDDAVLLVEAFFVH